MQDVFAIAIILLIILPPPKALRTYGKQSESKRKDLLGQRRVPLEKEKYILTEKILQTDNGKIGVGGVFSNGESFDKERTDGKKSQFWANKLSTVLFCEVLNLRIFKSSVTEYGRNLFWSKTHISEDM